LVYTNYYSQPAFFPCHHHHVPEGLSMFPVPSSLTMIDQISQPYTTMGPTLTYDYFLHEL